MDRCYYIGVHGCRVGRLPDTALSGTNKFMFFITSLRVIDLNLRRVTRVFLLLH